MSAANIKMPPTVGTAEMTCHPTTAMIVATTKRIALLAMMSGIVTR